MVDLGEKITDWKKVRVEYDRAIAEPDKEIREMHKRNFWFGVREYYLKYNKKFDYFNEPK